MGGWQHPPLFRYPGATYLSDEASASTGYIDPYRLLAPFVDKPVERNPIGRRIRFFEPPELTQYWINNEIRIFGKANWHPVDGMTGVIVAMPKPGTIGAGPQVKWDGFKNAVTWLGSVSRWEFIA